MATYVESALTQGEKIVYVGRLSWWTQFWYLFLGIVLLPAFGLGLVLLIVAWVRRRTTELAITDKRVIAKFGLVRRDTIELNLHKIESVQVHQSVMARILNIGSIIISGAGNPMEAIDGIADPMAFRRAFLEAQEVALGKHTPPVQPGP
jgi:uncharacterized membrane protein YdbT with pleckstrin-like domain